MEFCGITPDWRGGQKFMYMHTKNHARKPASKNVHGYSLSYYVTTLVYINTKNSEVHLWGKTNFLNKPKKSELCQYGSNLSISAWKQQAESVYMLQMY